MMCLFIHVGIFAIKETPEEDTGHIFHGCILAPLLQTWSAFDTYMDKFTCLVKCGLKLLIHFQTSTADIRNLLICHNLLAVDRHLAPD